MEFAGRCFRSCIAPRQRLLLHEVVEDMVHRPDTVRPILKPHPLPSRALGIGRNQKVDNKVQFTRSQEKFVRPKDRVVHSHV